MKTFFEKKDLAILQLVNYLFFSNQTTLSLTETARDLGLDKRTLLNTLAEYEYINLESAGLLLNYTEDQLDFSFLPHFSIEYLNQLLLRETLIFKLCHTLLLGKYININEFADRHFTSLSTIYRRIQVLKQTLAEYHISLHLGSHSYFGGEEKQIRHFLYEVYMQTYGFSDEYFTNPEELVAINEELALQLPDIPFPIKQKIKLLTYITTRRSNQGFLVDSFDDSFDLYDIQIDYSLLTTYINNIFTLNKLPLTQSEPLFFTFYLLSLDLISINNFATLNLPNVDFNHSSFKTAQEWVKELSLYFNLKLTPAEFFFLHINLYHHCLRNELLQASSSINLETELVETALRNEDPYIFKQIQPFLTYLEAETTLPNISSIKFIFIFLTREILLFNEKKIKVCVYSSLSHSQKVHVENKLQHYSPIPIEFVETITKRTDFVISNFYYNWSKLFPDYTFKAFYTSTFPSERKYLTIVEALLALNDKKHLTAFNYKKSN